MKSLEQIKYACTVTHRWPRWTKEQWSRLDDRVMQESTLTQEWMLCNMKKKTWSELSKRLRDWIDWDGLVQGDLQQEEENSKILEKVKEWMIAWIEEKYHYETQVLNWIQKKVENQEKEDETTWDWSEMEAQRGHWMDDTSMKSMDLKVQAQRARCATIWQEYIRLSGRSDGIFKDWVAEWECWDRWMEPIRLGELIKKEQWSEGRWVRLNLKEGGLEFDWAKVIVEASKDWMRNHLTQWIEALQKQNQSTGLIKREWVKENKSIYIPWVEIECEVGGVEKIEENRRQFESVFRGWVDNQTPRTIEKRAIEKQWARLNESSNQWIQRWVNEGWARYARETESEVLWMQLMKEGGPHAMRSFLRFQTQHKSTEWMKSGAQGQCWGEIWVKEAFNKYKRRGSVEELCLEWDLMKDWGWASQEQSKESPWSKKSGLEGIVEVYLHAYEGGSKIKTVEEAVEVLRGLLELKEVWEHDKTLTERVDQWRMNAELTLNWGKLGKFENESWSKWRAAFQESHQVEQEIAKQFKKRL